jgi:RNA polymerase sigma-70 factor, ECF subfamily
MKPTESQAANLDALFRNCGRDLGAYFARRHGGPEAAEDLVQESFLQLARRLRTGPAPASLRAYLFGVARHVSLAFIRKRGSAPEPLDAASDHAAAAEPDARLAVAREVIAALPGLQREILDLRFAHGLSYAEMATALDIPVGTVRSRLHHAVTLLRERLEAEETDAAPARVRLESPNSHLHEN